MNLKQKLQFIESSTSGSRPQEKKAPRVEIGHYIDGELISTPYGECFVTSRVYEANYEHGTIPLNNNEDISWINLGKDERLMQMELARTLFFDTETTGLSGGVGNYIFLAGFGYFENDRFYIKQFFLRDFNEEMAFLYAINQLLERFTGIVSYNGKSFDWPLLQNRYTYSRLDLNMGEPLHLDLLHTARRIWKRRLGDCSLQNIEREILNFYRESDIASYLIPHIYFQYLHNADVIPLIPVFKHNEWDILSLAALLIKASRVYNVPFNHLKNSEDLLSLAKAYENMQQWHKSITIYKSLLNNIRERNKKTEITLQLGYSYKRLRLWNEAAAMWQHIITTDSSKIEPYIELAKYYEHHKRDYTSAVEIVNRALKILELREQLYDDNKTDDYWKDLTYRLQRILKKQLYQQKNNS